MRVVGFILAVLIALAALAVVALFGYAVSLQTSPVTLAWIGLGATEGDTGVPVLGFLSGYEVGTNVASVCCISAGVAAVVTLLALLALGAPARRARSRRHDRQVALLKQKLSECGEEIERLRGRLRPEVAPDPFAPATEEPPSLPSP